jgi:hypothetical protein
MRKDCHVLESVSFLGLLTELDFQYTSGQFLLPPATFHVFLNAAFFRNKSIPLGEKKHQFEKEKHERNVIASS